MKHALMQNQPCPICGETDYSLGMVNPHAPIRFKVEPNSLWAVLFTNGLPLTGRACNRCGNVQLFVENLRDLIKQSPPGKGDLTDEGM